MPIGELFDDLWSDDAYDLAVYDEFVPRRVRPDFALNQFADGQEHTMRQKGGQITKKHNVPFIILSNFSPQECISEDQLPMFDARFDVVKIEDPIDVEAIELYEEEPLQVHSDQCHQDILSFE